MATKLVRTAADNGRLSYKDQANLNHDVTIKVTTTPVRNLGVTTQVVKVQVEDRDIVPGTSCAMNNHCPTEFPDYIRVQLSGPSGTATKTRWNIVKKIVDDSFAADGSVKPFLNHVDVIQVA